MIRTPYESDPQDATTPVDGMDIIEMLREPALTLHTDKQLMEEAADEIVHLRQRRDERLANILDDVARTCSDSTSNVDVLRRIATKLRG